MTLFFSLLSWLSLFLLFCNFRWLKYSRAYLQTVPGSLERARVGLARRTWRWPGFSFWPCVAIVWPHSFLPPTGGYDYVVGPIMLLLVIGGTRADWRRLKREIAEDDQDWFNKTKKALKGALRDFRMRSAVPHGI